MHRLWGSADPRSWSAMGFVRKNPTMHQLKETLLRTVTRPLAAALALGAASNCFAGQVLEEPAAPPVRYRVDAISKARWVGSSCWGLNADGYVVGDASLSSSANDQVGFIAAPSGRIRTAGIHPKGDATAAYAVNTARMVVGASIYERVFGFHRPAAWDADGTPITLPPFGEGDGSAWGVNDAGDVVGEASANDGALHAVMWADGSAIDLSPEHGWARARGINDRRQVAMTADGLAYRYQDGAKTPLGTLGGQYSEATAINAAGHVVGYATLPGDRTSHAFLWKDGQMLDLGAPEGGQSYARAVNAHDMVVGHILPPGTPKAFIWRKGRMWLLDDLLDPATGKGWRFEFAGGINDAGRICASGNLGTALLTPMR
jgi:probable HAF family extracellular repeat protein